MLRKEQKGNICIVLHALEKKEDWSFARGFFPLFCFDSLQRQARPLPIKAFHIFGAGGILKGLTMSSIEMRWGHLKSNVYSIYSLCKCFISIHIRLQSL